METMEHRWRANISSCIRRRQLDTDNKHNLNSLFDIERVAKMKSSRLIPLLCLKAYCAGPPHRITTTIGKKRQACLQALRGTNKLATRVAQITSLGFICSMFVQHRTPIIHWLLGAVAGLCLATTPQTALVLPLSLALSLQMLSASYTSNKSNTYYRRMPLTLRSWY
ncbi:hypothetical protein GGF41_001091 [Coemansia sp. RSA 2531]|nr:hypothetical protein GGF41_001091 [Coemansia sp. RSA 2531]